MMTAFGYHQVNSGHSPGCSPALLQMLAAEARVGALCPVVQSTSCALARAAVPSRAEQHWSLGGGEEQA